MTASSALAAHGRRLRLDKPVAERMSVYRNDVSYDAATEPEEYVRRRRGAGSVAVVMVTLSASVVGMGCGQGPASAPGAPVWEDLPPPSWQLVARRDGQALLAANRTTVRGMPRRGAVEPASEYPTLILDEGRLRQGPIARFHPAVLRDGGAGDTLRLYVAELRGRAVLFGQVGDAPPLHESPTEAGSYLVERGDHLWLLGGSGGTRLTADTTRRIARDSLRTRTAEGGPHLYWATHPLWSPDGSMIVYATNRSWMLSRVGGQEMWLVEPRTRAERPLLSVEGEFFLPDGWLGSEVVYKAREGGIFGIDARTGDRRTIGVGVTVAFSQRPPRLLYMNAGAGDTLRAHVMTDRGVVDVPAPPPGERLDHAGAFSPSGERLVLATSFARDSGITRAMYTFDLGASALTPLVQWSLREGTRHPQGLPVWLDEVTLLVTFFDRATGLESARLARLAPHR